MVRRAAALIAVSLPLALAPAVLAAPASAAPVQLTEAQLDGQAAGRNARSWAGLLKRGGPRSIVIAPQISIVRQVGIAIALGGTASVTNVAYTIQWSGAR